jgi:XisH protein
MPSYDQCHEQVMRALQKDGWQIDEQQVPIKLDQRKVFVDMRVGRVMNGSRQQMLLLEVKCFPDAQNTTQEIYSYWAVHSLSRYAG